jgi:hypothetical protein
VKRIYPMLYSIALFSFFSATFTFLGFWTGGTTTRWIGLSVITLATIGFGFSQIMLWPPRLLMIPLYAFWLYILLTVFWSENFYLSLAKWVVFVSVSFIFLVGGMLLGSVGQPGRNPFSSLAPIYLTATVSSIISLAIGSSLAFSEGGAQGGGLFQGSVEGPNMLGSMLAFSSPWIIVQVRNNWSQKRKRRLWLFLAFLGALALLLTKSRAASLMVLTLILATVLYSRLNRKFLVAYAVGAAIVLTVAFSPGTINELTQTYVYKSGPNLFYTRQEVWQTSFERALDAGVFGVGFGVSSGLSSDWSGQLTSVGFGREKGSSELAVWEELGVAGLVLYVLLLAGTAAALGIPGKRFSLDPDTRFYHFLTVGFFVGAFVSSSFEAWFTAPGSPESAAYWAVLGMGFGVFHRARREFRSHEKNLSIQAADCAGLASAV